MSTTDKTSVLSVLETHEVSLSAPYLIAFSNQTDLIAENEEEAEWISD